MTEVPVIVPALFPWETVTTTGRRTGVTQAPTPCASYEIVIKPSPDPTLVNVKPYNWSRPSLPPEPPTSPPVGDPGPPIPPFLPPPPPPPPPPSPGVFNPTAPAGAPSALYVSVTGFAPTPNCPPPPPPPEPANIYSLSSEPFELNIFKTDAPPPAPPAPDHPPGPPAPPSPPLYPKAFLPPIPPQQFVALDPPLPPLKPGAICKVWPGVTKIEELIYFDWLPAAPPYVSEPPIPPPPLFIWTESAVTPLGTTQV